MTGKIAISKGLFAIVASLVLWGALGCRSQPVPVAGTEKKEAASRVAGIIFMDLEKSCKCVAERTKVSWANLQAALKNKPSMKVERIHMDTQEDKAEPYDAMRSLIVPPGIYFLDGKGGLVDLLQGEIKKEQIDGLLK